MIFLNDIDADIEKFSPGFNDLYFFFHSLEYRWTSDKHTEGCIQINRYVCPIFVHTCTHAHTNKREHKIKVDCVLKRLNFGSKKKKNSKIEHQNMRRIVQIISLKKKRMIGIDYAFIWNADTVDNNTYIFSTFLFFCVFFCATQQQTGCFSEMKVVSWIFPFHMNWNHAKKCLILFLKK